MSDVTLFHIWPSLCSQKARLALAEKGVDYVSRIVNIGPPMENYEPWYVRMNPAAVVPTLKHGDRIVTDSARILRYVDEAFDGPALAPTEAEARADMNALMARIDALSIRTASYAPPRPWQQKALHVLVGVRQRRLGRLAAKHPDLRAAYDAKLADVARWREGILAPDTIEAARAEIRAVLGELEARLSDERPFVMGERYTLADVMATVLVARTFMLGQRAWIEDGAHLHLARYYARMKARPSFAAATIMERVRLGVMAPIVLPFVLRRLAVAAVVLGGLTWLALAL